MRSAYRLVGDEVTSLTPIATIMVSAIPMAKMSESPHVDSYRHTDEDVKLAILRENQRTQR
jgi:hypothetical protein